MERARYAGLRAFGNNLINHVTLKVRREMGVENIMLVDSPGMIDSPVQLDTFEDPASASSRDRGYDFPGVIRWFAERADVILLFFDPDKPVGGTIPSGSSAAVTPCVCAHAGNYGRDAGLHDPVAVRYGPQAPHHPQQGRWR